MILIYRKRVVLTILTITAQDQENTTKYLENMRGRCSIRFTKFQFGWNILEMPMNEVDINTHREKQIAS